MDITEAVKTRHSIRQYTDRPIAPEAIVALQAEIEACNREGDLHIQLVTEEPKAFGSLMAHYGKFSGVRNYIALIGKKGATLEERCGYYGERLVLLAQQLGLNSCWVALTFKKVPGAFQLEKGEKLALVIALGYGRGQGVPHPSKEAGQVSNIGEDTPDWFDQGVAFALLAPTAMNQQKFMLTYQDGKVKAKAGVGFYTGVDLGIVKYHFELGAGRKIAW